MTTAQKVLFKRKTTDEIEQLEIEDGSLIYNVDNGKTYMDYGNERIQTGGNADTMIYVGDEEPTDEDIKLWIDTPTSETKASEIVTEYTESDKVGYCTNYINELNTYSTDEIRVGTWIDGKPIYRKVLEFTNVPTGVTQINHGISNFDKLINYSGYYYNSTWGYNPIPAVTSDNISGYGIGIGDFKSTTFYFNIGNLRSSTNEIKLIVEYTKTTD